MDNPKCSIRFDIDRYSDKEPFTFCHWIRYDTEISGNRPFLQSIREAVEAAQPFTKVMVTVLRPGAEVPKRGKLLEAGRWYYFGCTNDGAVVRQFLDGVEIESVSLDSCKLNYPKPVAVTITLNTAGHQTGHFSLDEIRLYSRALSADEMTYLHTHPAGK